MPRRYFRGTAEERFWHYIAKDTDPEGHWIWTGETVTKQRTPTSKPLTYGLIHTDTGRLYVHRFAWELLKGPIPDGLQIDHICRVELCAHPHPKHLEPVTNAINSARSTASEVNRARQLAKTHCKNGHPFTANNLGESPLQRVCLRCKADRQAEYRRRNRSKGDS